MDLQQLQTLCATRNKVWTNDETSLLYRAVELAGEVGEAMNVIKKLEREGSGWTGSRAIPEDLSDELGDVIICACLLANKAGINLAEATKAKFNKTSVKYNLPVFC
jgi:NTP pyrophosphatase (non-canonical NTP hydrolase)